MSSLPPSTGETITQHATAIALGTNCLLITGKSGAGKSDMALRMLSISGGAGWAGTPRLVADDQVVITRDTSGSSLTATCPDALKGLLEVRGLGIISLTGQQIARCAQVKLIVALTDITPARYPLEIPTETVLGFAVPVVQLDPHKPSSPMVALTALATGFGWS